jgi:DNA-binding transcriptional LysR family regulator
MQFQTLREFCAVAEALSFSAASEKLFLSQATLSKHIRELEREFDAPLFARSTRRVELTELGLRLLPYARQALALEGDMLREIEEYHERSASRLNIGFVNRWDGIDLGKLTVDFQAEHPHTCVSFTTDESERLMALLKKDQYSFIIVREMPDVPEDGLNRLFLCEDPLYAFLPSDHPLASAESIQLSKLRQSPFLVSGEGTLSYKLGVKACMDAGFEPNIIYRGGRPQAMNYLAHGLGVGLMFVNPTESPEDNPTVTPRPLEPKVYANVNLVYRESALTDAGWSFLEFMKRYKIQSAYSGGQRPRVRS